MKFNHRNYVPCVRWKLGEYRAIYQLSKEAKGYITPLVEVPEMGFDFESWTQKKSVDDHLAPFAKRVRKKWQKRPCFVDMRLIEPTSRMANGWHPARYVFRQLRLQGCRATPVVALKPDEHYLREVRRAASKDQRGVCLRISLEEAAESSLRGTVKTLLAELNLQIDKCDLVLDLQAPNFEPLKGFARLLEEITRSLPYLRRWRTFTLMGTSFPASMAEITESPRTIPRFEWLLYKRVAKSLSNNGVRLPTFGDYVINHPAIRELDWRKVKPAATIRYTANDAWFIVKGRNVRDYKFEQY